VDSPTQLTVVTPSHLPGTVTVQVTTTAGASTMLSYTYFAAPVVNQVPPVATPGVPAPVTGSGFTGTETVTIDGQPVAFTVVDDGELRVTAPAGCHGMVELVATGPGGTVRMPFNCGSGGGQQAAQGGSGGEPRHATGRRPVVRRTQALASTGADVGLLALAGTLLLATGTVLARTAGRRRRPGAR
jgi:hypothetical protein